MKNVKLYLDDLLMDLFGNEDIAGTYSIADFAKLETRQSNRTIEFGLPLTQRNKKNLENIQIVNNASRKPYRVLTCRLYVNGINMNLDKCIIRKISDKIYVRLYGGNKNFYDLIGSENITACDLSEYDHNWNHTEIQSRVPATEGAVYSLINYGFLSHVANRVDCERLFPSVYNHSIVRAIIEDAGYSVAGNLFDDDDFVLDITPFSNSRTRYSQAFVDNHNAKIGLSADELNLVGVVVVPDYYKVTLNDVVNDPGSHFTVDGTLMQHVYVPEKNYNVSFRVKLIMYDWEFSGVFDYRVKVFRDGDASPLAEWYGETGPMDGGLYGVRFDQTSEYVEVNAGEKIYLEANIYASGTGSNHHTLIQGGLDVNGEHYSSMEIITDDAGPSYGDFWEVAANLPDISKSNFMKYVLQEFGCLININEQKKIVTINKFDRVIRNKAIAKDWSNKVLTDKTETNYELKDYAQTNHCKYLDDDAVVKPAGTDYDLLIDNETLDAEGDLFIAPFAATAPLVRLLAQLNVEVISLTGEYDAVYVDNDDDGTAETLNIDYQKLANVKPRILHQRIESSFYLNFYSENTFRFSTNNFFRPYFIDINQSYNLGWQYLIPYNSQLFVDILQSFRIIIEQLRINESDINLLDHFVPVWIEKHYSYFYISSIDQFIFTKKLPTSVMLVKI